MAGRIVILNGAPRSGKSTLARAIQANVPGTWINWGVDRFNASLPDALLPGIPEPVRRWQVAVHAETDYDLRLDMGILSPEAALSRIVPRLDSDVPV